MKTIFTLLTILTLGLTGCAGTMEKSTVTITDLPDGTRTTMTPNVDNSPAYGDQQAYIKHMESEGRRLAAQTASIMAICEDCTGVEKAYSDNIKMVVFGFCTNFRVTKFDLEKSKTLIDVADNFVGKATDFLKVKTVVGGAVSLADKLIDKAGTTNIQMGDSGVIDGSFNNQSYESQASTLYGDAEVNTEVSQDKAQTTSASDGDEEEGELYCTGDSQCEEGYGCDEPIFTCVKKDY